MLRTTTNTNHNAADFADAALASLALNAEAAATAALRRVGGTAVEWGRRSGSHLNTSRLAAASLPDARVFGRPAHGDRRPECGIVTLIDSSGSMGAGVVKDGAYLGSRRRVARSIAVGIAAAARRCGLASIVGHHGDNGRGPELVAHRTTRGVLNGPSYGGNSDAWAVAEFCRLVEMPAQRTVFVLVCDGSPNGDEAEHRAVAAEALAWMNRSGVSFILAYIGDDSIGLDRARLDWGAQRVADCREDMTALTGVMIRAVAAARR